MMGAFCLGVFGRQLVGVYACVFLIPFNYPLYLGDCRVAFQVPLLLALWAGSWMGRSREASAPSPPDGLVIVGLSSQVWSIVMLLLCPLAQSVIVDGGSVAGSASLLVSGMVGGVVLYALVVDSVSGMRDLHLVICAFVATVLLLLLVIALMQLHVPMPYALRPVSLELEGVGGITRHNFTGFQGFAENFGEYLVIVCALGYALLQSRNASLWMKILAGCAIVTSLCLVLPNAVKAVPIMIFAFALLYAILQGGRGRFHPLMLAVLLTLGLFLTWRWVQSAYLVQRFKEVPDRIDVAKSGKWSVHMMSTVLGRDQLETLWEEVLPAAGLFGVGPLIITEFSGSNMPFHNIYYQIWLDYGFLGLAAYGLVFATVLWRARRAGASKDGEVAGAGNVVLVLLLVLLIEQMKVSAFRMAPGILTWWLLFGIVSVLDGLARAEAAVRNSPDFSSASKPRPSTEPALLREAD